MDELYNPSIYAKHNEKAMEDFLKKHYPYFPKFKVYADCTNESIRIEYGEVTAKVDFENLIATKKTVGKDILYFYIMTEFLFHKYICELQNTKKWEIKVNDERIS